MRGVNYANICAIISRGFVAMYGMLIAIVVEAQLISVDVYCVIFALILVAASALSLALSNMVLDKGSEKNPQRLSDFSLRLRTSREPKVAISALLSIFVGLQFISVVVAYAFCFGYPQYRLIIISIVPVVSMLGTTVTVVLLEPRLSRIVDSEQGAAFSVASAFLRARSLSFLVGAIGLFALGPWLRGE